MGEGAKKTVPCCVYRLGLIDYPKAFQLQNRLADARRQEGIGDVLLLLQHPAVVTMGKSGKIQNILQPERLEGRNIRIVYTDRGGDVTYHGPGQLVVYPILDIRRHGLSVPGYVSSLEEMTIRLLARYGIQAGRMDKMRGVWVGQEKIASLGVHLSRWVSKHGLALNVNTDLDPFRLINPCGTGRSVTSIARLLGHPCAMEEIETEMIRCFADVFGVPVQEEPTENLNPYF